MIVTGVGILVMKRRRLDAGRPGENLVEQTDFRSLRPALADLGRTTTSSAHTIAEGVASFIIAASSAGDCRAYSGTTISPSDISARSNATQRMLFGAIKRDPIALLQTHAMEINFRAWNINASNSPPVTGDELAVANLAEQRNVRIPFDPGDDVFEKRHDTSTPLCASSNSFSRRAERRKILLPAKHAATHRKFRIPARDLLLEVDSHARHGLQVPRHRLAHRVPNLFLLPIEGAESADDAIRQVPGRPRT